MLVGATGAEDAFDECGEALGTLCSHKAELSKMTA